MGAVLQIAERKMSPMKIPTKALLILTVLMWASALFGAAEPDAKPTWYEHSDVLTLIIGGLLTVVMFFMIRTLNKIDRNQNTLFTRLDDLGRSFYTLQGEHNVMMNRCQDHTRANADHTRADADHVRSD